MTSPAPRLIWLRYPAGCVSCGRMLSRGDRAWWDAAGRCARCVECVECSGDTPSDPWAGLDPGQRGTAGRSAQSRYEAKRLAREDRIRSRHPVLGGLVLVVTDEPASITAWRTGAAGERRVGRQLDALAESGRVEVLHDRALSGSRANFDHLVVGPSGIFVVDAKRYKGKVEVRRDSSWLRRQPDRLFVNGRDRSLLVEAMARQVDDVEGVLHHLHADPPIEVTPVLCFIDAEWPLLGSSPRVGPVHIVGPRGLNRLVSREGSIGHNQRLSLARRLADALPPARTSSGRGSGVRPGG